MKNVQWVSSAARFFHIGNFASYMRKVTGAGFLQQKWKGMEWFQPIK